MYAPCTSPFIKPEIISQCIKAYLNKTDDCDCIATVSSIKEFMWLDGKPVNYNPLNAPNSQNLPNIVALNFEATVTSREDLIPIIISLVNIRNSLRHLILKPLILILRWTIISQNRFIRNFALKVKACWIDEVYLS